jgi:hypothetical protein
MARAIKKSKKGPVRAKKVSYDGINFASGLEKHMYKALQKAGIDAFFEDITYELVPAFEFDITSYERLGNGKGDFKDRGGKKVLNIKYTPDFIIYNKHNDVSFIIECKGRANESFPIRWKLFKKLMAETNTKVVLFKPQNHNECDKTVETILNLMS